VVEIGRRSALSSPGALLSFVEAVRRSVTPAYSRRPSA
jgi:hypothetical protein